MKTLTLCTFVCFWGLLGLAFGVSGDTPTTAIIPSSANLVPSSSKPSLDPSTPEPSLDPSTPESSLDPSSSKPLLDQSSPKPSLAPSSTGPVHVSGSSEGQKSSTTSNLDISQTKSSTTTVSADALSTTTVVIPSGCTHTHCNDSSGSAVEQSTTPAVATTTEQTTEPPGKIPSGLLQVAALIPELRDSLQSLRPLNQTELMVLKDFVDAIQASLSKLPPTLRSNLTDMLEAIENSGLLDVLKAANTTVAPGTGSNVTKQPPINLAPYTDLWPKCQLDVATMLQGLSQREFYALGMIDASGKPGRSILLGNFLFLGNNDQCTGIHYKNGQTLSDFRGKTCRAMIQIDFNQLGLGTINTMNRPIIWDICLPDSCQSSDLTRILYENQVYNVEWHCTEDLDMKNDLSAIIAVIILALFGVMLIVGSLVDVCVSFESRKKNDTYVIDAFATKSSAEGMLNQGFELRETKLAHASMIELPVGNESLPMHPHTGNGVLHKRTNGEKQPTGLPEIPDFSDYRNGFDIKHHQQPQQQKKDTRDSSKNMEAHLPRWQKALLAFSVQRNTGKILSVQSTPASITCLHGIRVLSLGWVILGHVILFGAISGQFENSADIFSRMTTLPFQIVLNGPLSVDTFYFMTGFLTCYLFLKECAKKRRVTCKKMILYYVHRYWRLTPPYAIWIMIVAALLKYVGSGRPGWSDYPAAQACRDRWWANLLYVNSLYTEGGMCVGVSWFLANDMMYYIVAPIVMIPWVYKQRVVGIAMALGLLAIHLGTNGWLINKYNFDIVRDAATYSDKLYFKPYTRVGPFAVGLIFGYILHLAKGKLRMNKFVVCFGWVVSLALIFTLALVTYDENNSTDKLMIGWPAANKAAYETLARPLWGVAIGWIVLACASGYGGFINSFLSWPGWLPLSRLTYCAYLIHNTVLSYEMYAPVTTHLFTDIWLIYVFVGYYAMSYFLAYLLAVAVESPMLGLEKVALSKK